MIMEGSCPCNTTTPLDPITLTRNSSTPKKMELQVDHASSSETRRLTLTEEGRAHDNAPIVTPPEVPRALHGRLGYTLSEVSWVLCFMHALCAIGFLQRHLVSSRWTRLMESSGFRDWPPMGGVFFDHVIAIATLTVILLFWAVRLYHHPCHRLSVLRVLSMKLLVSAVLSWIAFVRVFASPIRIAGVSEDAVTRLAEQSTAAANFNRGYCQAWCRQSSDGLAMLLHGDCDVTEVTVFDGIVGKFTVGEWCKQAIAKQNFELVPDNTGVSPFASLKEEGTRITNVSMAMLFSIVNGLVGVYLAKMWCRIRKIVVASE